MTALSQTAGDGRRRHAIKGARHIDTDLCAVGPYRYLQSLFARLLFLRPPANDSDIGYRRTRTRTRTRMISHHVLDMCCHASDLVRPCYAMYDNRGHQPQRLRVSSSSPLFRVRRPQRKLECTVDVTTHR